MREAAVAQSRGLVISRLSWLRHITSVNDKLQRRAIRRPPNHPHYLPDLERSPSKHRHFNYATPHNIVHLCFRSSGTRILCPSLELPRTIASTMSEDRLWKFRKPEWLNSVYARNAGVYSAGALVCRTLLPSQLFPELVGFALVPGRSTSSARPGHAKSSN